MGKQNIYELGTFSLQPIPFLCDSLLEFLQTKLTKKSRILEFGSGGSTLWFGIYAGSVLSFEHHLGWYEAVQRGVRKFNLTNVTVTCGKDYPEKAKLIDGQFDVILIDGYRGGRVKCVENSISLLAGGGYMILDDVRFNGKYVRTLKPAIKRLNDMGWKRLEFKGKKEVWAWQKPMESSG